MAPRTRTARLYRDGDAGLHLPGVLEWLDRHGRFERGKFQFVDIGPLFEPFVSGPAERS